MLTNVKAPFKEGETVPVTLQFEKAGAVTLDLPVQKGAGGEHQH
jgi:periplasmic copper chaperone A